MKDKDVAYLTSQNKIKANYAERVIKRYITYNDDERYIDCLQDIKGSFYKAELQKVKVGDKNKLWKINKVLKTCKHKENVQGTFGMMVTLAKKFDSWVP